MRIKTSDLKGAALDWAVAFATKRMCVFFDAFGEKILGDSIIGAVQSGEIRPSSDWSQGGPLIEKFDVWVVGPANTDLDGDSHVAWVRGLSKSRESGPTKLTAAMRSIVSARLADVVDVPEELVK